MSASNIILLTTDYLIKYTYTHTHHIHIMYSNPLRWFRRRIMRELRTHIMRCPYSRKKLCRRTEIRALNREKFAGWLRGEIVSVRRITFTKCARCAKVSLFSHRRYRRGRCSILLVQRTLLGGWLNTVSVRVYWATVRIARCTYVSIHIYV